MTQTSWPEKQREVQEDFIWDIGPEALYQMTRAENKTEPDEKAIKDLIRLFNENFFPKKICTTTELNSSEQSRPKQKPRRNSGGD